jgi:hypothetical protein
LASGLLLDDGVDSLKILCPAEKAQKTEEELYQHTAILPQKSRGLTLKIQEMRSARRNEYLVVLVPELARV